MSTQTSLEIPVISVNNNPMIFKFFVKVNGFNGRPVSMESRIGLALSHSRLDFHKSDTSTPGQVQYTVRCSGLREAGLLYDLLAAEGYPLI
jgi:hypothetical protein